MRCTCGIGSGRSPRVSCFGTEYYSPLGNFDRRFRSNQAVAADLVHIVSNVPSAGAFLTIVLRWSAALVRRFRLLRTGLGRCRFCVTRPSCGIFTIRDWIPG